jgi:hypothetical protein
MNYSKVFKNCNVIYFKKKDDFLEVLNDSGISKIFKGKIIVSDTTELEKICGVYGIIHVLNLGSWIPNDNIDCVVSSENIADITNKITKSGLGIPVLDISEFNKWCGICGNTSCAQNTSISKWCSEKCMKKDLGFTANSKPEPIKDLEYVSYIKFDTSENKTSKSMNKFQKKIETDSLRLQHAYKRESYKKEMRQPTTRKISSVVKNTSNTKNSSNNKSDKICKSLTKKAIRCTNRCIGKSDYCGIISHMKGETDAI